MRGATDRLLARNSQTSGRPTCRERHGRPADGQTVTPSNSRQAYHLPQPTRSATNAPRIAPRPMDTGSPSIPARESARPRDPLKREGPPLEPETSMREASRVCLFSAPSTTPNGAPEMTSSNRQPMRVFPPCPDAVRLRASSRLVPPFQVSTIFHGHTHTLVCAQWKWKVESERPIFPR